MDRRPLGATGIEVGEVGLGAWQLGNRDQWTGPDRETSLRIVDEALKSRLPAETVAAIDQLWADEIAGSPLSW